MSRSRWIASKRVIPIEMSRRISGVQASPITERVRAIEQFMSSSEVRVTDLTVAARVPDVNLWVHFRN
jgi:hypothetical protein